MRQASAAFLVGLALPFIPGGARAVAGEKEMELQIYEPVRIKWQTGPPSIPAGAMLAVLEGDPGKPGPFVMRLRLPRGYQIPPHTHPQPERLTVISGTFHIGMGEKFDKEKGKP